MSGIRITCVCEGLGSKACHGCNIPSVRALPLLSLFLLAGVASTSDAQQTPGSTTANAVGTVYDSIRVRPLAGARVIVDSTTLSAVTDEGGRFHLEGIPPGPHFLRVAHPFLDTLTISLRSEEELYAAGQTKAVELATPVAERIIAILCSPAWRARGPAALMGRVYEADTGKPASGAKLSLVWYEVDVGAGVRRVPRVREAAVAADGTYRICGLPPQLDGRAQVLRGALTSGDVPISFGDETLFLRSLSIAAPGAVVAVQPDASDSTRRSPAPVLLGTARLTGRVLSKEGRALPGARVQVEGTTRAATTRLNGEFVLDSLPAGSQSVTVRLLGYAPVESAVDLSSREPRSVTLVMDNFVPMLETVRVSAQRERALDDVGFARRKRTGQGWYMEGDAIKQRNSLNFSDLLRGAPGIRITTYNNRQVIQSSRDPMGGCVNIWVDGTQWQQMEPGDVDDFVKPYELGAVEVYSSSMTPAEYQPTGRTSCTTIVAWTTRRLDRKR